MKKYLPLLARIFLSLIFLKSGIEKIIASDATQQYMQSKGVSPLLLIPTIVVLLLGSLSILLGYRSRIGALMLVGFLIPATLIFHTDFSQSLQEIQFFKNLGLIGGLLMVVAFGAGEISFDKE